MTKQQIETPLVILPAAGYGRRMGSPPAKELVPHPKTGHPIIEEVLKNIDQFQYQSHVILRSEKQELKNYLLASQFHPQIQEVEPTEEWPATVLLSEPYWRDHNILYLPDTEFEPLKVIQYINEALCDHALSFATFNVETLSLWGTLRGTSIGEKVKGVSGPGLAWGLIGFKKNFGRALFETILNSFRTNKYLPLPAQPQVFALKSFDDLTRSSAP